MKKPLLLLVVSKTVLAHTITFLGAPGVETSIFGIKYTLTKGQEWKITVKNSANEQDCTTQVDISVLDPLTSKPANLLTFDPQTPITYSTPQDSSTTIKATAVAAGPFAAITVNWKIIASSLTCSGAG